MNKLEKILEDNKVQEPFLALKKNEIRRNLEASFDDVNKQVAEARRGYEELCQNITKEDADLPLIINRMLSCKETIVNAKATIAALIAIRDDLYSEVKE